MKRLLLIISLLIAFGCATTREPSKTDYFREAEKAGLNIDADSNDKVDEQYGGTNRALCSDNQTLLSNGSSYDCVGWPDTDESGTVDFDETGDPGANVSITMGSYTFTLDGTTYDCVFNDGAITCDSFSTSGSDPYLLCRRTDAETMGTDADHAGRICMDTSGAGEADFYYYVKSDGTTEEQLVSRTIAQILTNKTVNAEDNTLTIVEFKTIESGEFLDNGLDNTRLYYSPYMQSYYNATALALDPSTPESPQEVYSTATNTREILITLHDSDATETIMRANVSFPPNITGMGASAGLKVRWVSIIIGTAPSAENIEYEIAGTCLTDGDSYDYSSLGTFTAITLQSSDAQNDIIESAWTELGTDNITNFGTNEQCVIHYRRSNPASDDYAGDVGFIRWEFAYQRQVQDWSSF